MTSRQQVTPPEPSATSRSDWALTAGVVTALVSVIAYYLFFSEDAEVKAPADSPPLEEPR